MSFNLASCWLNWDCNRTHYMLSNSRSSLSFSPSRWASLYLSLSLPGRIDFFFFSKCKGNKSKGREIVLQRENERYGIVINWSISSPMFSFTLQEFFRLLCNELATHYALVITNLILNKNRDSELVRALKLSRGELASMHLC